jgi:hypothetical protein
VAISTTKNQLTVKSGILGVEKESSVQRVDM